RSAPSRSASPIPRSRSYRSSRRTTFPSWVPGVGARGLSSRVRPRRLAPAPHEAAERTALAASGKLLHELLHLAELLDELVHFRQFRAGTRRDAAASRGVEDGRVTAFDRGHGPDDRLGALEVAAIDRGLGL